MSEKCTCSKCGRTFIPSFLFDFYPEPTKENPKAGLCEICFMSKIFSGQTATNVSPVSIPKGYQDAVCKKGKGKITCSFLGFGEGGFICLKGSSMETVIRGKLRDGSMRAKGDNCSGPPQFLKK
jgi:hypothetical protein